MDQSVKIDRHVLIRGLSSRADYLLTTIAHLRGVPKHEVIKDALEEYVERHKGDIARAIQKT